MKWGDRGASLSAVSPALNVMPAACWERTPYLQGSLSCRYPSVGAEWRIYVFADCRVLGPLVERERLSVIRDGEQKDFSLIPPSRAPKENEVAVG